MIADSLRQQHLLVMRQPERICNCGAVYPGTDDVAKSLLRRTGKHSARWHPLQSRRTFPLCNRHHTHPRVIGHIHQIERCFIHKVLITGNSSQVACGHQLQLVCGSVIEVAPEDSATKTSISWAFNADGAVRRRQRGSLHRRTRAAPKAVLWQGVFAKSREDGVWPVLHQGRPPDFTGVAATQQLANFP